MIWFGIHAVMLLLSELVNSMKTQLIQITILKKKAQITDGKNENFRDPKFSHDYEYVCWLQNPARGAHFQCSKLMMVNFENNAISNTFLIALKFYSR